MEKKHHHIYRQEQENILIRKDYKGVYNYLMGPILGI